MSTSEQPAATSRKPVTKSLVVCGADDTKDAWFFGNFVGFCRALQVLGVDGEFWSCFPVRQYFEIWDSVKFGEKGPGISVEDRKELAVFTKADYNNQRKFWTHWDSSRREELPSAVLDFVKDLSEELEASDILNLILMGHGNTSGIKLGGQTLRNQALADALSRLKPGVRVNVIVQSCHSGAFVETIKAKNQKLGLIHTSSQQTQSSYPARLSISGRHRNSQFSGAFLQSLGFAVDPDASDWTLEGHINWVKRVGKGSGDKPELVADPQHHITDLALVTNFVDVLFTECNIRNFIQAANVARRVLTPPHPTTPPRPPQTTVASGPLQAAVEVIAHEVGIAEGGYDERDAGLASTGTGAKWLYDNKKISAYIYQREVLGQMGGFRWRIRIQENFFVAMAELQIKGLIDFPLAFLVPIDWNSGSDNITCMLESFSLVDESSRLSAPSSFEKLFDSPVYWLAIIIARTCTDFNRTIRYLATSGWLGNFDEAHYRSLVPKSIKPSAKEGISATRKTIPPQLGFWLPCDTSSRGILRAIIRDSMIRYRRFRTAYEACFGYGSWGDNFYFDMYIEELVEDIRC
ncbi:hypothetical protein N7G274_005279 [Stereocaulon virgatum]|uniref:Uncharacterized protein n=1 Tax=Stereocaulon virgatum TaxID=373712 RepID=A0ABR4AB37_9LECA